MAKGKRSPTAHRTPEQIREHGRTYQSTPKRKAYRAALGRIATKKGSKVGDGKDNAHKKAVGKGGSINGATTSQSPSKNRGHGTSRNGTKPSAATLAMRRRVRGRG